MGTPALILAACLAGSATQAQDAADLSREIANPLADVTLLPFQLNSVLPSIQLDRKGRKR